MLEKLDVPPLRLIAFNILTLTSPLWSTLKSALSGTKPPAQNLIELLDVPYPVIPACPFLNKTRSHTDNFGENNVKCLIAKGICRFVPHSSAGGF